MTMWALMIQCWRSTWWWSPGLQ